MDMIKFTRKMRKRKKYDKWRKNKIFKRKNGFTQKDIAIRLGVEPAAISKYELDMREPNITNTNISVLKIIYIKKIKILIILSYICL